MCVGTKGKSQVHHWVMTQGHDGLVTFWESLTGQRSGKAARLLKLELGCWIAGKCVCMGGGGEGGALANASV